MRHPCWVGLRVSSTDVLVSAILWDTVSSALENGRVINRVHSLVRHMNLVGLVRKSASQVAHRHYAVPFPPTSKASLCAVVVGVVVVKRQRRTLVLVVGIDFEHGRRHNRHTECAAKPFLVSLSKVGSDGPHPFDAWTNP